MDQGPSPIWSAPANHDDIKPSLHAVMNSPENWVIAHTAAALVRRWTGYCGNTRPNLSAYSERCFSFS